MNFNLLTFQDLQIKLSLALWRRADADGSSSYGQQFSELVRG